MGFADDACSNRIALWTAKEPINLSPSLLFIDMFCSG
jgi:hypothetical protein